MAWVYNEETKEYDAADPESDNIDALYLVNLRDGLADRAAAIYTEPGEEDDNAYDLSLTALYLLGYITLSEYEAGMRKAIQDTVIAQWALAKGGIDNLTEDDQDAIEVYLLVQFGFLSAFMSAILLEGLTDAEIYYRAGQYFSNTVQSFENGRSRAYDARLVLPFYPGDCTSQCCAGDRCFIMYNDTGDMIMVDWVRTANESCPTCISRGLCPELTFDKVTAVLTGAECWAPV